MVEPRKRQEDSEPYQKTAADYLTHGRREHEMAKHNVLLVCGSGASSGFMAANIRKAAKKAGEEISVKAVSESAVEDYVEEIDCLMIGPHLASTKEGFEEVCEGYPIHVVVMKPEYYSHLDGEQALTHIHEIFGE